jgi:glycosyltransferase involved in cell wall biosynthesis
MTAYNHEEFVGESIGSILGQTLHEVELVVVDDGSDDGTLEVVHRLATDERIVVIPQPRLGRGRALNVALQHSRGEYIAVQDADDLAEPTRLEKQVHYLQEHQEVGVLGGHFRLTLDGRESGWEIRLPLTDAELRRTLPRRNPFAHSTIMMPRSALERAGGYDESLSVAIDYDLWIRIASQYQLANLPDVLTVQRIHRSAYIQNRIDVWDRWKTNSKLRWRAMREFSRNPLDVWYLVDPIGLAQWIVRDKCPAVRRLYHRLTCRPHIKATKTG